MLKSNTKGFVDMTVRHADEIRWNVKCSVSDDGIFGITDTVKLFDASEKPSCVALFFVGMANATRFIRLMSKVRQAAEKLRQSIAATSGNPEKIKVPAEVKNYLSLVKRRRPKRKRLSTLNTSTTLGKRHRTASVITPSPLLKILVRKPFTASTS